MTSPLPTHSIKHAQIPHHTHKNVQTHNHKHAHTLTLPRAGKSGRVFKGLLRGSIEVAIKVHSFAHFSFSLFLPFFLSIFVLSYFSLDSFYLLRMCLYPVLFGFACLCGCMLCVVCFACSVVMCCGCVFLCMVVCGVVCGAWSCHQ